MDHPKIVLATIKEGGNASSRQLTRQQIGIQTQKLYKVQAQKILRKANWVGGQQISQHN